jgi:hypothetical protein
MPFEATIAAFVAALAQPAAPPPSDTRGRLGAPDARRFSVYRNNVAVGLIGALEARFPITRRIVGPGEFRAMARAFVSAQKPRSPVMIAYGDDFPEFVAKHLAEPNWPYLGDVARLENAWVEAYHAAEGRVATAAELGELDSGALPGARIQFHPAARLLTCSTPAASIWADHQEGGAPSGPPPEQGEDILVTRPAADVMVRVLPRGGYGFAEKLRHGATLAGAAETLSDPGSLGTHLVGLVESGAVAAIIPGETP